MAYRDYSTDLELVVKIPQPLLLICGLYTIVRMTLNEYFKDEPHGSITEMAQYIGVSPTWMSLLIHGHRKASFHVAVKLEKATQGLVTLRDLRPDLYVE